MPKCVNIPEGQKTCYYKGDESSPRGLGFCAKYFDSSDKQKGTDGFWYHSNGIRWIKSRELSSRGSLDRSCFDQDSLKYLEKLLEICKKYKIKYRHEDIYNLCPVFKNSKSNKLIVDLIYAIKIKMGEIKPLSRIYTPEIKGDPNKLSSYIESINNNYYKMW